MNDAQETLVEHRLGALESAIKDIRVALKGIEQSLVTLTKLEVRHAETREALARAHKRIDLAEERLRKLELSIPLLDLTSRWVRAGVIGIVSLVIMAIARLVIG